MREKRFLASEALRASLARAEGAGRDHDLDAMFAPLAEALLWLTILNDSYFQDDKRDATGYEKVRDEADGGRMVLGLIYARNRLTHDIDITGMHGLFAGGLDFPINWPAKFGRSQWRWRSLDGLPAAPKEDAEKEDAYKMHLEGEDVYVTLERAAKFIWRVSQ